MAYIQFQLRRDTAATWASVNPVLASGEIAFETDTGVVKIGDGSTAYASLSRKLTCILSNTSPTLQSSNAGLVLANPTGSQTMLIFQFAGVTTSGLRGDSAGNMNWACGTGRYHQIYGSLDTSVPIANLRASGALIGGTAGGTAAAKLHAINAVTTQPAGKFTAAAGQTADTFQCESSGGTGDYFAVGATGITRRSTQAGITASTTQTQGQGPLAKDINQVSVVANANDTVTLPSAAAGMEIVVVNSGANTLQVFPASGDDLGAGVDTATTQATGVTNRYVAYDAANWVKL